MKTQSTNTNLIKQADPIECLLKNFKSLLLSTEELLAPPPEKAPEQTVCENCKTAEPRELPCLHHVCEKCIDEKMNDELTVSCPVCGTTFNHIAEGSGFFVCQWEDKSNKDQTEIKIFGDSDMLLNFQFVIDFANDPKFTKISTGEISIKKYFDIFRKDSFRSSDEPLLQKRRVLLYTFPKYFAVGKSLSAEYKVSPDSQEIVSISKALKLHSPSREIAADQNKRAKDPITVVSGAFLPDKTVNFNFGCNITLVKRLLQKLYPRDEPIIDPSINIRTFERAMNHSIAGLSQSIADVIPPSYRTQDQLPPEPPLPLTRQTLSRPTYKSLASALYQAPCNEFEERIMRAQKYKDFSNPIFTLNNELITQAKEIADSLTTKNSGVPAEPLPKCEDFSFDLYQQVKCKKYRYCAQCCPDVPKDKMVYSKAVWELVEQEREKLATHKCLNCKEYLCPTCANLHKMKNMDHKYQFKVDRKDYYSIRRARQEDVIKTMNDLIREKVKCALEKVNNDVSAHLMDCVNNADGKYSTSSSS